MTTTPCLQSHTLKGQTRFSPFKRFRKDSRGTTIVEFALVAAPFFVMLIGLFEVCLIFIATTTMEHGISEAARRIRTGELQQSGASAESFKKLICDNTFGLLDCDNKLKVDVRVYSNFGSAKGDDPLKDGAIDDSKLGFDAGEGSDIILARVFYEWQILTPIIGKPMSNMKDDKRLLQASMAFRNEPFGN